MIYILGMKQTLTGKVLPEPLHAANLTSVIATGDLTALNAPAGETISDPLEAIRVRAETVSTLLREIMDHGATRHWGINE